MNNLKDNVTTIIAIVTVIIGAVTAYLQANAGQPINWMQFGLYILGAIVAYFTGKNPNGSTKVIDPTTGQQDINPNATKASEPVK